MPSLKDLKVRISSVKNTQKITSAMKMVSAAKLRRAQEQAEAARPYAERMERVLAFAGGRGRRPRRRAGAAGRHRQGPGPSAGGHDLRPRPVRRLQLLDRASGPPHGARPEARGQDAEDPVRRPQGARSVAPRVCAGNHRQPGRRGQAEAEVRRRRSDRKAHSPDVRAWRVRRLHRRLQQVQVGDDADRDGAAVDPVRDRGRGQRERGCRR